MFSTQHKRIKSIYAYICTYAHTHLYMYIYKQVQIYTQDPDNIDSRKGNQVSGDSRRKKRKIPLHAFGTFSKNT
jgi:hypothetical protein